MHIIEYSFGWGVGGTANAFSCNRYMHTAPSLNSRLAHYFKQHNFNRRTNDVNAVSFFDNQEQL